MDHNPDRIFLDEVRGVRISTTKDGDFYATMAYTSGSVVQKTLHTESLKSARIAHRALVRKIKRIGLSDEF